MLLLIPMSSALPSLLGNSLGKTIEFLACPVDGGLPGVKMSCRGVILEYLLSQNSAKSTLVCRGLDT